MSGDTLHNYNNSLSQILTGTPLRDLTYVDDDGTEETLTLVE
jgi:hypothetical protein